VDFLDSEVCRFFLTGCLQIEGSIGLCGFLELCQFERAGCVSGSDSDPKKCARSFPWQVVGRFEVAGEARKAEAAEQKDRDNGEFAVNNPGYQARVDHAQHFFAKLK